MLFTDIMNEPTVEEARRVEHNEAAAADRAAEQSMENAIDGMLL